MAKPSSQLGDTGIVGYVLAVTNTGGTAHGERVDTCERLRSAPPYRS
jgi:hypothetical protein